MDRMKSAEGQKGTDFVKCYKGTKIVSTLFNKPILSYKIHPFFV